MQSTLLHVVDLVDTIEDDDPREDSDGPVGRLKPSRNLLAVSLWWSDCLSKWGVRICTMLATFSLSGRRVRRTVHYGGPGWLIPKTKYGWMEAAA